MISKITMKRLSILSLKKLLVMRYFAFAVSVEDDDIRLGESAIDEGGEYKLFKL